jgi:hypothetical protein
MISVSSGAALFIIIGLVVWACLYCVVVKWFYKRK